MAKQRVYRVEEPRGKDLPPLVIRYDGFNRRISDAEYVAAYMVEGEIEWYALDHPDIPAGSIAYLEDNQEGAELIGVFKKL